jgi:hypothetical protein
MAIAKDRVAVPVVPANDDDDVLRRIHLGPRRVRVAGD